MKIISQIQYISHLKSQIFKILVLIACIFTNSPFFSQYISNNSPKEDFWIYNNTSGIHVNNLSTVTQSNVKAAQIIFYHDEKIDIKKSDLEKLKNTDELWNYLKLNNFKYGGHVCPNDEQKEYIKNLYFLIDNSTNTTQIVLYIPSNLNMEWLKPISKLF